MVKKNEILKRIWEETQSKTIAFSDIFREKAKYDVAAWKAKLPSMLELMVENSLKGVEIPEFGLLKLDPNSSYRVQEDIIFDLENFKLSKDEIIYTDSEGFIITPKGVSAKINKIPATAVTKIEQKPLVSWEKLLPLTTYEVLEDVNFEELGVTIKKGFHTTDSGGILLVGGVLVAMLPKGSFEIVNN